MSYWTDIIEANAGTSGRYPRLPQYQQQGWNMAYNYLKNPTNFNFAYTPDQLNTQYEMALNRMQPQFNQNIRTVRDTFGGRGIYNSGAAVSGLSNELANQDRAMSDWWVQAQMANKGLANQGNMAYWNALQGFLGQNTNAANAYWDFLKSMALGGV